MELEIIQIKDTRIAHPVSKNETINSVQDALDLIGNADYEGATKIILDEGNLNPEFFDLSTGFAGEMLQKFSNYRIQLAITGEFEKYNSGALKAFIIECNRGNMTFFTPDFDAAVKKLA